MNTAELLAFDERNPRDGMIAALLADMSEIASPPEVYLALRRLIEDDRTSAADIGAVIERDPALSARLLRVVNSPWFAAPTPIETLPRAITRLGLDDLVSIALSVGAVDSFSRIAAAVMNMRTFWAHSVYCAVAARELARSMGYFQPERLFVAGLLHDVGMLAINSRFPELAEANVVAAAGNESRLAAAERDWLGFDHAGIGATLLERWGIHPATCAAIRHHHEPAAGGEFALEARIVQLADLLANETDAARFCGVPPAPGDRIDPAPEFALLGLDANFDRAAFVDEVARAFGDAVTSFYP